jgi:uncharacterized protein YqiB (DUF1249 family)
MAKRYFPDLTQFMIMGERNYARLLKLVPDWEKGNQYVYRCGDNQHIIIRINELFKYTAEIFILFEFNQSHHWTPAQEMTVRLYHDASLAEVIATKEYAKLEPVYEFPNPEGRYPDEKQQMNRLLSDWLVHCLDSGYIEGDYLSS